MYELTYRTGDSQSRCHPKFSEITQQHALLIKDEIYRAGQKRTVLRVDNVVLVNGTKVCDMSKVSEFCLEKHRSKTGTNDGIIALKFSWKLCEK